MDLKIVEVVVLLVAGVLFVTWQFRDLRRAKEITRLQREAEKLQVTQRNPEAATKPAAPRPQNDLL